MKAEDISKKEPTGINYTDKELSDVKEKLLELEKSNIYDSEIEPNNDKPMESNLKIIQRVKVVLNVLHDQNMCSHEGDDLIEDLLKEIDESFPFMSDTKPNKDGEKANDSEYFDNENFAIVETKNEKPYLFYEGEKYYFGEEYEFSDDGEHWVKKELVTFNIKTKYPLNFMHIRKIDHTSKYKKRFLELKIQAEKDGVNLKDLI